MTAMHRLKSSVALLTVLAATMTTTLTSLASAAVPGLVRVQKEGILSKSNPRSVTVHCPPGTVVVSTGFHNTSAGEVVVDELVPSEDSVTAHAYAYGNGTTTDWRLYARAVCANPLPFQEIVSAIEGPDSDFKSATAHCPGGKLLVGSGWQIGGNGQVGVTRVVPGRDYLTVTAYEDDDGATTTWEVTAIAICAAAVDGLEIVSSGTTSSSYWIKSTGAHCPSGKVNLGGGFEIAGGSGNIVPVSLNPGLYYQDEWYTSVTALEDDDGTTNVWSLTTYAICADE